MKKHINEALSIAIRILNSKFLADVRFENFTAVIIRIIVFLDVTPCSMSGVHRINMLPPSSGYKNTKIVDFKVTFPLGLCTTSWRSTGYGGNAPFSNDHYSRWSWVTRFTIRALHALRGILLDIVTCVSDSRRGFGLENAVIYHFNTRLGTTLNYSAIADLHILQITRAHNLAFSVSYSLH
jgi:hypothetical protein